MYAILQEPQLAAEAIQWGSEGTLFDIDGVLTFEDSKVVPPDSPLRKSLTGGSTAQDLLEGSSYDQDFPDNTSKKCKSNFLAIEN